jgi:hypothetical protein
MTPEPLFDARSIQARGARHGDARTFGGYGGETAEGHGGPREYRRGPRGYRRSDASIEDEVCERLTRNDELDGSDVAVRVRDGEVTLAGTVADRGDRRLAEDLAAGVAGVRDVHNRLRVVAPAGRAALERVWDDMPVLDDDGREVGRVVDVYLGSDERAATVRAPGWRQRSLAEQVAATLAPDWFPAGVRDRLLRRGFVRIDPGWLGADRYALADQIALVADGAVRLTVRDDDLLRR